MYIGKYKNIFRKAKRFCHLDHIKDLEALIEVENHIMMLLSINPPYYEFELPKKSGGMRNIEAPELPLKKIQRKINAYLQCVYYFSKTPAAYGFIISFKFDPAPRNIITNAERHIGNQYMINVDLKDFFHQIKRDQVFDIFKNHPFSFKDDLANLLSDLTTRNGRLPMGTPTSPVLTNFATIALDNEIINWALGNRITYTRYADDLCFSANYELNEKYLSDILIMLQSHQLEPNPQKIKIMGRKDPKEVTGLIVEEKVVIPANFYEKLQQEINGLKEIWTVKYKSGDIRTDDWLKTFDQSIKGKLNFISYVEGKKHQKYQYHLNEYFKAVDFPKDWNINQSWLDFPYNF